MTEQGRIEQAFEFDEVAVVAEVPSPTAMVVFDAPELQSIEASKAKQIKATFEPMAIMLAEFEDAYMGGINEAGGGITKDVTVKAKRLRIDIGKVRIATEKLRVAQKEEYLKAGKAIDGVSNILKWAIGDKEAKLKEIEDHFQIQERKRLEALQADRVVLLAPYVEDAHERNLSEMEDDVWFIYLGAKKKDYNDQVVAEKQAEEDRIAKEKADAEERERFRAENERLKKEAEERERLAKIEADKRAKADAERIAKEEAERKEREETIRKERKAREKLEAEIRGKEEAELKAAQDAEAQIQADLNKGDAAKVKDLVADLGALKTKYSFKSAKNKKMYLNVGESISEIISRIERG